MSSFPAVFWEMHSQLPRQGPGDADSTRRAFQQLRRHLPESPRVLDIGCGPGAQTRVLASELLGSGHITALDKHSHFLDELKEKTTAFENVEPVTGDMFDLQFPEKSFDLIWSEGAIYIIGFERGLMEWKRLLKPGGCVALTELSWLAENPPDEPVQYWKQHYPQMKTIEENLKIAEKCGYRVLEYFVVPESAWMEEYYAPLLENIAKLEEKYAASPEELAVLSEERKEIRMYEKHCNSYGYVFYVMTLS